MKVSQDLILGIAIGAGVALVLAARNSGATTTVPGTVIPSPKTPTIPAPAMGRRRHRIGNRPWTQYNGGWGQAIPLHV